MPEERVISFKKSFIIIAAVCFIAATAFAYEVYLPHPGFRGKKEVVIAQGLGSREIGALLKREGVIRSKWAFVTYVWLRREASSLKPGRYEFFDTAAIPDVTRDLVAGEAREREIVIPEGWGTEDIAAYLAVQGVGDAAAARRLFAEPPREFLARFPSVAGLPAGMGLEGYLFPDTYRIFENATFEEVAAKMLENFDRKLTPDLRQEITRQKKTVHEAVTMASLIEKEVASDDDRAMVSGILWKRLDAGIPLQVDASVVYAKTKALNSQLPKNGKISITDTKIDSPYNTYRYRGLPPGPIANPGLSAIRAAIYPQSSPYLYYLSAPDGRTIFSKTLEEHNAAKARYLR
ncbi:MAG: UPF0755 protein [Parcubacteria group bacterium Greene0714_36]|nr:MAG: UPF0755 protein [Parcubacteria group bacterium Greene0714_36]